MARVGQQFSTGVTFLDRRIGGGVGVGSTLVLVAPATSQSQVLLHQFTTARPFHFVSTTCPDPEELAATIDGHTDAPNEGTYAYVEPEGALADPQSLLNDVPPESYLVLGTVDAFERAGSRAEYLAFMNALKRRLTEQDAIAVLHAMEGAVPHQRCALTQKCADHVWQYQQLALSESVRTQLLITKARRAYALTETIPLIVTDRVRIDTTRNI